MTILLDIDGTLIDSNDAHAHAWVDAGREFGLPVAYDQVRWLIGMGGDRVLPRLTGLREGTPEGDRVLDRRGEIFRERYLPDLQPTRGARELVEALLERGHRLVVATSAGEDEVGPLLEQAGVRDLLPRRTSSDDAESSKPAPDIVEAALQEAGSSPIHAAFIGDTPYDVQAGRNAGVRVIAVRTGGWTDPNLAGAVSIHDDAAALLAHYDRTILAQAALIP